jgi:hypothetical protein
MRVVSRVGVLEGLCGGSILGLIRVVMRVVCVGEWGVPVVRLITMGTVSTCVHGKYERSAFARVVHFFYDEVVGVFN